MIQLLKERNEKIADLARGTGILQSTLSMFINRKGAELSMRNAIKIADYFGVTLDELVRGGK